LAFAAATVHDAFNLLSVCVLLPIEIATGYLYFTTNWLVKQMLQASSSVGGEPQILSRLTKPLTNFIIQLNNEFTSNSSSSNSTLIKHFCPKNTTTLLNNGTSVTMIDAQNKCKRILFTQR
jgi:sodium-dependent phosphate cotransporter